MAAKHQRVQLPIGRTCETCGLTQAKGEYDDSAPCPGKRTTDLPRDK